MKSPSSTHCVRDRKQSSVLMLRLIVCNLLRSESMIPTKRDRMNKLHTGSIMIIIIRFIVYKNTRSTIKPIRTKQNEEQRKKNAPYEKCKIIIWYYLISPNKWLRNNTTSTRLTHTTTCSLMVYVRAWADFVQVCRMLYNISRWHRTTD